MNIAALIIGLVAAAGIIAIGLRFWLDPVGATRGFGLPDDGPRGFTEIKGSRDITSGVVVLVAWAAAGQSTFGWVLLAAAITPVLDAIIVVTNGGRLATAISIHGLTAALLVAAGLVLAL